MINNVIKKQIVSDKDKEIVSLYSKIKKGDANGNNSSDEPLYRFKKAFESMIEGIWTLEEISKQNKSVISIQNEDGVKCFIYFSLQNYFIKRSWDIISQNDNCICFWIHLNKNGINEIYMFDKNDMNKIFNQDKWQRRKRPELYDLTKKANNIFKLLNPKPIPCLKKNPGEDDYSFSARVIFEHIKKEKNNLFK